MITAKLLKNILLGPTLALCLAVGFFSLACSEVSDKAPPASTAGRLIEATAAAGVDFLHDNGSRGKFFYVEIMSGGGGLFDFDNDGDLDLYVLQGHDLEDPSSSGGDRLFRNDGLPLDSDASEMAVPQFVDISEAIGLDQRGYGLGLATADFDNDGWIDIFLTQFGANVLLRNLGGTGFEDVTAHSVGLAGSGLSSSATFVDFDQDGWLDLYVVNYLRYNLAADKACYDLVGLREYCGPQSYEPAKDRLFRNRGDGTFEDVSVAAGIDRAGAGLGLVTGDFDGDGRVDIYVGNDQAPNFLWMNQGGGTFREEAMFRGSAVDRHGKAEASMGIDAADLDHDGDLDLLLTHLIGETNTLYRNDGQGLFEDASLSTDLGTRSLRWTGFGCSFFDLDRDGWLDVFVANGAVRANPELRAAGDDFPYREPNLLFINDGHGGFEEVSVGSPDLAAAHVSRGVAPGDLDNDGDLDLVVFNGRGPLQIFVNPLRSKQPWIGLRLVSKEGRDALGARVSITRSDGQKILRRVRTAGYLTTRDPRLLFGLGDEDVRPSIEVLWPDGSVEGWTDLENNQYHLLEQGQGTATEPSR